jgi:hypothetical protein
VSKSAPDQRKQLVLLAAGIGVALGLVAVVIGLVVLR